MKAEGPTKPGRGAIAGLVVCVLVALLAFAYIVITQQDRSGSLTHFYGSAERTGGRGDA